MKRIITKKYLQDNPNHIFVFGDNTIRKGLGGAAKLRNEPNSYGFTTKIYPDNKDISFYNPESYYPIFMRELHKLMIEIRDNQNKTYLISKLGAGLANRYNIWDEVIKEGLVLLTIFDNVEFLYEKN